MKAVDQARNALAFLEDAAHQQSFDTLIWGLRERRDAAAREIEEWEELRTLASQIKQHTLANLARYLELFEARATANGATVHWARDAQKHNQIVLDILNSQGASSLVKSKSMLTEECELRPFLERRGIQVTETDLGERIQQLDDQPPTHIVGPAFQKTPEDVANMFHRVYGSDPSRLCRPAVGDRRALRTSAASPSIRRSPNRLIPISPAERVVSPTAREPAAATSGGAVRFPAGGASGQVPCAAVARLPGLGA